MGKPVIATNWSGPTEFVSEHVGYLLPTLGLVDAKLEAFPKHQWAEPDGKELERLLKHLKEHREEARRKGENARAYVVQHWSNTAVSKQVASHLERLAEEPSDNDQSREEL